MTAIAPTIPLSYAKTPDRLAPVRVWLWTMAVLIFAMVIVGGATRLTESGLSITEWKPLLGVVPPLSEAAWLSEFEKYKQIPQYARLFPSMELADFKVLYGWEWSHRLLGRILGIAFAVPLALFWWQGRLKGALRWKLLGILALGGLQGVVGWWMVASGLANRVEVAPERLAIHLLLATLTIATVVWIAVGLRPRTGVAAPAALRATASLVVGLVFIQIGLGALVAGGRAGLTYNTFPLMDGHFVPPSADLLRMIPWWKNFVENVTTVQFDHRIGAYLLLTAALVHVLNALRVAGASPAARGAALLALLVAAQAGIGIATLLFVVPLHLALTHQAFAMVVLVAAVVHRARLAR